MTCPTCDQLRNCWYMTATPITTPNVKPEVVVKVRDADRKRDEYQDALKAYREHRKSHNAG